MSRIIGETRRSDFYFARERSDGIPIEPTPPVEGWGKTALQWLCLIAFFVAAFIFAGLVQHH